MFNILNMHGVCADLGLPFDQFLKRAETGMGTKLFLRKSTIHSANLLITESWAICMAWPSCAPATHQKGCIGLQISTH